MKSSAVSAERFLEMACRIGRKTSKLTRASATRDHQIIEEKKGETKEKSDEDQIPGLWLWVNFLTSDSVGFWPRALRMSPIWQTWTQPSPFWSNNWNASWKSIREFKWILPHFNDIKNRCVKSRPIVSKGCHQLSLPYKVWKCPYTQNYLTSKLIFTVTSL